MFVIGLIVMPRLMLLYYGFIPAQAVPPILGFLFVPRMFLASIISSMYGNTNPGLVAVCWILAVIFDLIGIAYKIAMYSAFMEAQKEYWS